MVELCKRTAESEKFQQFITLVILFAGVLVGVETSEAMLAAYGGVLHFLDKVVIGIFTLEIAVKMIAEGNKPWRFFKDRWNVFDFVIVAACFLPIGSQYATVLRLVRLLRVLRLVRALPKLQMLVGALLKSIPSMGYVSVLLLLLFYVYGVAGVFLFHKNDPVHFGSLGTSMLSLFRTVTLEDWTDIMYTQIYGCDVYAYAGLMDDACVAPVAQPVTTIVYFVSFVLLGTMIVLNLFIGVIMNGMQEAQAEAALEETRRSIGHDPSLLEEVEALRQQLAKMSDGLNALAIVAARTVEQKKAAQTELDSLRPPPPPSDESPPLGDKPAIA